MADSTLSSETRLVPSGLANPAECVHGVKLGQGCFCPHCSPGTKRQDTSKECNVVKLANQDELAKARETLSKVVVPDLPAEIIARAYMRLQCADVPREPWHWEVCQILQTPQVPTDETVVCVAGMPDYVQRISACVVGADVGGLTMDWARILFDLKELAQIKAAQKVGEGPPSPADDAEFGTSEWRAALKANVVVVGPTCGKDTPDGPCRSDRGHEGDCDGLPY
jgi:hypothetical protein